MKESNLVQTIESLSEKGWNSDQVNNILETLSSTSPAKLAGNIQNLFCLFALLPASESNENSIDYLNAFSTPGEYREFINLLRNLSGSILENR